MAVVHDVAAALVARHGEMTAMKLEKLVYYCQCWHLARLGAPLFNESIEAWRQGPVVPVLFEHHRGRYTISSWPLGDAARLTVDEWESIRWVVANYGNFSAIQLSRMTHNELPWRDARGVLPDRVASSQKIRLEIIKLYYSRQIATSEEAVTLATANAALEGIDLDAEWQDRLRDAATGMRTADELVAEEIERLRK